MGVGEANLDEVLVAAWLGDSLVVVVADDLVANVASLEAGRVSMSIACSGDCVCVPSEAYTTAGTRGVAEDPARADFVGSEDAGKFLSNGSVMKN
jgi:hypothetical protein